MWSLKILKKVRSACNTVEILTANVAILTTNKLRHETNIWRYLHRNTRTKPNLFSNNVSQGTNVHHYLILLSAKSPLNEEICDLRMQ